MHCIHVLSLYIHVYMNLYMYMYMYSTCLYTCCCDFHMFSYLHKNDIVHGNLSLASIFIQHNGAVKIGSGVCVCVCVCVHMWQTIYGGVLLCTRTHTHTHTHTTVSPDAIHEHVKTKQLEHKARLHYTAPEYAGNSTVLYICSHCACKHVHV